MRVTNSLELVNMSGFARRRVADLSGGEQQRVALARALAPRPRLLMFDEPLGALDRSMHEQLLDELRRILQASAVPAIYVTHDQEEAIKIADRILLLHDGQIVQQGTPAEVYAQPASAWVANFLGLGKVIEGIWSGSGEVETVFGVLEVDCETGAVKGQVVRLLIRPEHVKLENNGRKLKARIKDVIFQKNGYQVTLNNGLYYFTNNLPKVGEEISFSIEAQCLG